MSFVLLWLMLFDHRIRQNQSAWLKVQSTKFKAPSSKSELMMRKLLLPLCLLLLLTSTAAAQSKSRSWLHGFWKGTGYQTDDQTTWSMQLTITRNKAGRRVFVIEYPSLNCGGYWKLLRINGNRARFRELLDHGQDKCSNKGLVRIETIGSQLIFLYSNQGSPEITASAVLNREAPAAPAADAAKATGRQCFQLLTPGSNVGWHRLTPVRVFDSQLIEFILQRRHFFICQLFQIHQTRASAFDAFD